MQPKFKVGDKVIHNDDTGGIWAVVEVMEDDQMFTYTIKNEYATVADMALISYKRVKQDKTSTKTPKQHLLAYSLEIGL